MIIIQRGVALGAAASERESHAYARAVDRDVIDACVPRENTPGACAAEQLRDARLVVESVLLAKEGEERLRQHHVGLRVRSLRGLQTRHPARGEGGAPSRSSSRGTRYLPGDARCSA